MMIIQLLYFFISLSSSEEEKYFLKEDWRELYFFESNDPDGRNDDDWRAKISKQQDNCTQLYTIAPRKRKQIQE
jgi:hypothetical protein